MATTPSPKQMSTKVPRNSADSSPQTVRRQRGRARAAVRAVADISPPLFVSGTVGLGMPARARAGWPANAGVGAWTMAAPPGLVARESWVVTLEQRHHERLLDLRTGRRRFVRWGADQAAMASVTPARHQLLLAIRGHPDPAGPTIREMAGYLLVRHHSAVELVDRAGAAGLVERRQDGDDLRAVRLCHRGWGRPSCPAVASAPGGAQAIRAAARSAVGRTGHVPVGRDRVG